MVGDHEEAVIDDTADKLINLVESLTADNVISATRRILCVDDGSTDRTWEIIKRMTAAEERIVGMKLSHNQGHQNALLAGVLYAKDHCDCVITLDADLQDDIGVIPEFLHKFEQGNHIVYGVRNSRWTDTVFKRSSAALFYRVMNWMGAETIQNHADYRLMSRTAIEALEEYSERNLFLRGIIPLIGLKSEKVYYERKARLAGKTKYPMRKMVSFAVDGITSFSAKPLRIISFLGILSSFFGVVGLAYALISYFFGYTVPGWTAIVCSVWLLGGVQLLSIGVFGEYIGKIFTETKGRPRYIIEEIAAKSGAIRDAE